MTPRDLPPFLKYYFVYIFGNLSFQLREYSLQKPSTWINVVWNLILSGIVLYTRQKYDLLLIRPIETDYASHKPLFVTYINIIFEYCIPITEIAYRAHFLLYGAKIIQSLAQLCATQSRHRQRHCLFYYHSHDWWIFFGFFLFNQIKSIGIPLSIWLGPQWQQMSNTRQFILSTITYIVMSNVSNFICHLVHYQQFITYDVLQCLHKEFQQQQLQQSQRFNDPTSYQCLRLQLRQLAEINSCLNQQLSFPLCLYYIITMMNNLNSLCIITIVDSGFTIHIITHTLVTTVYLIYVVRLNQMVVEKFCTICFTISNVKSGETVVKFPILQSSSSIESSVHHHNHQQQPNQHVHYNHNPSSTAIIYTEIVKLYRDKFALHLFTLVSPFNLQTFFAACLFISNLAIFIYQTN